MQQFEKLFRCCNKNKIITSLAGVGLGTMLGYGILTDKKLEREKLNLDIPVLYSEPSQIELPVINNPDILIEPEINNPYKDIKFFDEAVDNGKIEIGKFFVSISAGIITFRLYKPLFTLLRYLSNTIKSKIINNNNIIRDIRNINDSAKSELKYNSKGENTIDLNEKQERFEDQINKVSREIKGEVNIKEEGENPPIKENVLFLQDQGKLNIINEVPIIRKNPNNYIRLDTLNRQQTISEQAVIEPINRRVAEEQRNIELIENYIEFLRQTNKNLESLQYTIKNIIELFNYLGR